MNVVRILKFAEIKENTSANDHYAWFRKPIKLNFEFETNKLLEKIGLIEPKNGMLIDGNLKIGAK